MSNIVSLTGSARQCHTCGKIGNLNHMLYIKQKWFCNAACHNLQGKEKPHDSLNIDRAQLRALGRDWERTRGAAAQDDDAD